MYFSTIYIIVFILFFLRPFMKEIWTIFQLMRSIFTPKIDIKKKYGSWAIVTGSTSGIGKAFALDLARRGLNIILISRSRSKLQEVASFIQKTHNVQTKVIVADFGKGREIYDEIKKNLEGLDIGVLINNVGIGFTYPMYFNELPEDELWNLMNINIASVTQMTKIVLPYMIENKKGAVVNISSGSQHQPLPLMSVYSASKIFVGYFTDSLRDEYKDYGITFQCLVPFYVSTKINNYCKQLMDVNLFIPTAETYARSALDTLGRIDCTTGYWPHRLQYFFSVITPDFIKSYSGGLMYRVMRKNYLESHPETLSKSEEYIDKNKNLQKINFFNKLAQ